jgi:chaperonin GroES
MYELQPLYDRMIVQRIETEEERTRGGLIKPGLYRSKPQIGRVLAIGIGLRTALGTTVPMQVKAGDIVSFGRHNGYELHIGDDTFLVLREDECFAIAREVAPGKEPDLGVLVDLSQPEVQVGFADRDAGPANEAPAASDEPDPLERLSPAQRAALDAMVAEMSSDPMGEYQKATQDEDPEAQVPAEPGEGEVDGDCEALERD